jgi:hypothetical protein
MINKKDLKFIIITNSIGVILILIISALIDKYAQDDPIPPYDHSSEQEPTATPFR